jgi:hypothetical protein
MLSVESSSMLKSKTPPSVVQPQVTDEKVIPAHPNLPRARVFLSFMGPFPKRILRRGNVAYSSPLKGRVTAPIMRHERAWMP